MNMRTMTDEDLARAELNAKLVDQMIKAFDEGVAAGRAKGYEEGYTNGYTDGHADGRREGLDDNPDRWSSEIPKRKRKKP